MHTHGAATLSRCTVSQCQSCEKVLYIHTRESGTRGLTLRTFSGASVTDDMKGQPSDLRMYVCMCMKPMAALETR